DDEENSQIPNPYSKSRNFMKEFKKIQDNRPNNICPIASNQENLCDISKNFEAENDIFFELKDENNMSFKVANDKEFIKIF
ncbi:7404_t:CDS:2, partial [Dentiscutata heterogama]